MPTSTHVDGMNEANSDVDRNHISLNLYIGADPDMDHATGMNSWKRRKRVNRKRSLSTEYVRSENETNQHRQSSLSLSQVRRSM